MQNTEPDPLEDFLWCEHMSLNAQLKAAQAEIAELRKQLWVAVAASRIFAGQNAWSRNLKLANQQAQAEYDKAHPRVEQPHRGEG